MIYEYIYHHYFGGVTFWPLVAIMAVFVVLCVIITMKLEADAMFGIIAGGAAGFLCPALMLICEKSEQISSHRSEAFTVCRIAEIILLLLGVIGGGNPLLAILAALGNYSACFFAGLTCLTFSRSIGTLIFILLVLCLVLFACSWPLAGQSAAGSENSGNGEGTIYRIEYEDEEKVVVKSEYGETFTYYKLADTWLSSTGECEAPPGFEYFSKTKF